MELHRCSFSEPDKPALAVHGGAGHIHPDTWDAHREGIARALEAGSKLLSAGKPAWEACIAAVTILEDNPAFNAGLGSLPNREGIVELDAGAMYEANERTGARFGAVSGVQLVRNPCQIAALLLFEREVNFLTADAALRYAQQHSLPFLTHQDFTRAYEPKLPLYPRERFVREDTDSRRMPHDTVGATARDAAGNMAAVTSTGGVPYKWPGRVGDSPLPGAGLWAEKQFAASSTGVGEDIMRTLPCFRAALALGETGDLARAVQEGLNALAEIAGEGGMIAMDMNGNMVACYNAPTMARGFWALGHELEIGI